MTLFPEKEVVLRGEFDIRTIKSSRNWRHLDGLEKIYAAWQLRIVQRRKDKWGKEESYGVYYCLLCQRNGKKNIKAGQFHESELIKGLRPYSDRPEEVIQLAPAMRSVLSMVHVYVSGCGGVDCNGWCL